MQGVQLPGSPLDLNRIGVWHLSHPPPEVGERPAHYPNQTAAVGVSPILACEGKSNVKLERRTRTRSHEPPHTPPGEDLLGRLKHLADVAMSLL